MTATNMPHMPGGVLVEDTPAARRRFAAAECDAVGLTTAAQQLRHLADTSDEALYGWDGGTFSPDEMDEVDQ